MARPKEKRFKTPSNRWGQGNVHRYLYDSLNKVWHLACRKVEFGVPHGREVDLDTPVTCKKCL